LIVQRFRGLDRCAQLKRSQQTFSGATRLHRFKRLGEIVGVAAAVV
jgi:hypothetical protein